MNHSVKQLDRGGPSGTRTRDLRIKSPALTRILARVLARLVRREPPVDHTSAPWTYPVGIPRVTSGGAS